MTSSYSALDERYLHPLADPADRGQLTAVELVADRRTRRPFEPSLRAGARITRHAQAAGLILRMRGDVMTLAPPFVITGAEIDDMGAMVCGAVEKMMGEIR